jgi:hypothetical protein
MESVENVGKQWDFPQWFNMGGKALIVGVASLFVTKHLPLWRTAFILEYVKLLIMAAVLVRSIITHQYRDFTFAGLGSLLTDFAWLAMLLNR